MAERARARSHQLRLASLAVTACAPLKERVYLRSGLGSDLEVEGSLSCTGPKWWQHSEVEVTSGASVLLLLSIAITRTNPIIATSSERSELVAVSSTSA
jgi:hypothetical protein